jgi:hypothetical protein
MDCLKRILREHRRQPEELLCTLSAMTPGELVRDLVGLVSAGELRLHARKRRKNLCGKYYKLDSANPWIKFWFLRAAREKRDEGCTHYSIGNLLEKLRHDVSKGIVKVDEFRISNDMQSVYVRVILILDPSLCGFFALQKRTDADALVVDGRHWNDFAKQHGAELWPERAAQKKNSHNVGAAPLFADERSSS